MAQRSLAVVLLESATGAAVLWCLPRVLVVCALDLWCVYGLASTSCGARTLGIPARCRWGQPASRFPSAHAGSRRRLILIAHGPVMLPSRSASRRAVEGPV